MHEHEGKICGKSWFHEDRYDPGDMSKCLVRLSSVGEGLRLEVKSAADSADPEDPEVISQGPVDLDSAKGCLAEKADESNWGPWEVLLFHHE